MRSRTDLHNPVAWYRERPKMIAQDLNQEIRLLIVKDDKYMIGIQLERASQAVSTKS